MKKLLLLLAVLTSFLSAGSTVKTISQPDYKYRTTGALKLNAVELSDDSARLSFTAFHRPGTWIKIDTNLVIKAGGEIYRPIGWSLDEIGRQYTMPASGQVDFTVVYPAIKGMPKFVDLVEEGENWNIYGIRLDGKRYKRQNSVEWFKANKKDYPGLPKGLLLDKPAPAKVEGVFYGYDKKTFGDNFLIYDFNELIWQSAPKVVEIDDDGKFKFELNCYTPKTVIAAFPHGYYWKLYVEPGRRLSVFFNSDRIMGQLNGDNTAEQTIFNGLELGQINEEVQAARSLWMRNSASITREMALQDAYWAIINNYMMQQKKAEAFYTERNTDEISQKFIDADGELDTMCKLLIPVAGKRIMARNDSLPAPEIPEDLAGFIQNGLDNELLRSSADYNKLLPVLAISEFSEIYGANNDANLPLVDNLINEGNAVKNKLNLDMPPLWWQNYAAWRLADASKPWTRDEAMANVDKFAKSGLVSHQFTDELQKFFNRKYSPMKLPDNEAGRLVKSIVDKYKGRYVMLNVWAPTIPKSCSEIEASKEFRDANRNNPDFANVFVTTEELIPGRQFYDQYVSKNLADEDSWYLTKSQFNLLRDLFGFTAVPYYILIDKDGKIIARDLPDPAAFAMFLKDQGVKFPE